MDKINNLLKALIGLLLIISFVITFSSCNKHEENNSEHTDQPGEVKPQENKSEEKISHDWNSIKGEVDKDEKELEKELNELEMKASKSSRKLKSDIHHTIEKIKSDKNKVKLDSAKPEFKEEWNSFKTSAKNSIDSLKKKL